MIGIDDKHIVTHKVKQSMCAHYIETELDIVALMKLYLILCLASITVTMVRPNLTMYTSVDLIACIDGA